MNPQVLLWGMIGLWLGSVVLVILTGEGMKLVVTVPLLLLLARITREP
jgi:FtsH-binding integral membrane protein